MNDEHPTKRCTKCDTFKPRDAFWPSRTRAAGLASVCKVCDATRRAAYNVAHNDEVKARRDAYYAANTDKVKAAHAAYYAANRDKLRPIRAVYRATNEDKLKEKNHAYRAARREKLKVQRDAYEATLATVEGLAARVSALEAVIGQTAKATVGLIAPERPRRKRAVHEHHTPEPVIPSATPPIIRTIRDIIIHDGATAAEAKRIQEREILARVEWRPTGNA
jgi:hypothetical protein